MLHQTEGERLLSGRSNEMERANLKLAKPDPPEKITDSPSCSTLISSHFIPSHLLAQLIQVLTVREQSSLKTLTDAWLRLIWKCAPTFPHLPSTYVCMYGASHGPKLSS